MGPVGRLARIGKILVLTRKVERGIAPLDAGGLPDRTEVPGVHRRTSRLRWGPGRSIPPAGCVLGPVTLRDRFHGRRVDPGRLGHAESGRDRPRPGAHGPVGVAIPSRIGQAVAHRLLRQRLGGMLPEGRRCAQSLCRIGLPRALARPPNPTSRRRVFGARKLGVVRVGHGTAPGYGRSRSGRQYNARTPAWAALRARAATRRNICRGWIDAEVPATTVPLAR